jgi:hypothetical protein
MKLSYQRRRSDKLGRALMVRAQPPLVAQIDAWIINNGERISRPEAVRRLATLGLSVSGKTARGDHEGTGKKGGAASGDATPHAKMRRPCGGADEAHLGQGAI